MFPSDMCMYDKKEYKIVLQLQWSMLCKLCQILGVLITYFLIVVQFANPYSSAETTTATSSSAVSDNYTVTATYSNIGQQVIALVIENWCQTSNLAADKSLNLSAILCTGVEK